MKVLAKTTRGEVHLQQFRPSVIRGPWLSHGQSLYWTAKSSFLFLTSDHTWADQNYASGVNFWTMIFYNLKNSGLDLSNEGSNFILSSLEVVH